MLHPFDCFSLSLSLFTIFNIDWNELQTSECYLFVVNSLSVCSCTIMTVFYWILLYYLLFSCIGITFFNPTRWQYSLVALDLCHNPFKWIALFRVQSMLNNLRWTKLSEQNWTQINLRIFFFPYNFFVFLTYWTHKVQPANPFSGHAHVHWGISH